MNLQLLLLGWWGKPVRDQSITATLLIWTTVHPCTWVHYNWCIMSLPTRGCNFILLATCPKLKMTLWPSFIKKEVQWKVRLWFQGSLFSQTCSIQFSCEWDKEVPSAPVDQRSVKCVVGRCLNLKLQFQRMICCLLCLLINCDLKLSYGFAENQRVIWKHTSTCNLKFKTWIWTWNSSIRKISTFATGGGEWYKQCEFQPSNQPSIV